MKTTQNLRQKLIDNPAFAVSFCKIALLINVGRVNTTLACTLPRPLGPEDLTDTCL